MQNVDLFFLLLGAVLVLAMHAGFAFLELGTVRHKNQVNALSKILTDFAISAIAYFFVGYWIAYGQNFFHAGTTLAADHGYNLMRCFFLLTFAAAIPAIISGGIAERAKMRSQAIATLILVALIYPFFEGMIWNGNYGLQGWLEKTFGAGFHDFAGSVVVHAMGGWIALAAVILLGARNGRYKNDGRVSAHPPSSIPFLALGSWILIIGWFGFNVMSAQRVEAISGLVAINSLMAMVGGTLAANFMVKMTLVSYTMVHWQVWSQSVRVRILCILLVHYSLAALQVPCLFTCLLIHKTSSRWMMYWGYGLYTVSVVHLVASLRVFWVSRL